jgi:4'-phosphopantetheinyl transferase
MEPLTVPPLGPDEVHVWTCELPPDVAALAGLLSDDEHARARRFRFDVHRRRFIAARGTARRLLGAYTGRDAASLRFEYEPLGKPRLADGGVSFNISHCDDRMMIAIRRDGEIGVDVERLRPVAEAENIAGSYFDPDVAEQIRLLPEPERSHLFLRYWTRHEAGGKFLGRGVVASPEFNNKITTLDLVTEDEHVSAVALEAGAAGGPKCRAFQL